MTAHEFTAQLNTFHLAIPSYLILLHSDAIAFSREPAKLLFILRLAESRQILVPASVSFAIKSVPIHWPDQRVICGGCGALEPNPSYLGNSAAQPGPHSPP
jgi:hypothetical protein